MMLLYPDFLESTDSYDANESMWKSLLDNLATNNKLTYYNYMNPYLSNGKTDRSANPIFTAAISAPSLGVRIIQIPAEHDQDLHITGWLDTKDDYEGLPTIEELVIALVLSDQTKSIAEKWIQAWLIDQVSKEQMKEIIKTNRILVQDE